MGGSGLLNLYSGSMFKLLSVVYPEHEWLPLKFSHRDTQTMAEKEDFKNYLNILKECIKLFFTEENKDIVLLEEYRHPDISNLELDFFLPQYNIAFRMKENLHSAPSNKQNEACREKGITLIEVPYWWDKQIDSLAATVYNTRPDLMKTKPQGKPIPLTAARASSTSKNYE